MSLKAGVKAARGQLQSGDAQGALVACTELIQQHAASCTSEADQQILYALYITKGMAATAFENWHEGITAYRAAVQLQSDLPQAWKGLVDCLTAANLEAELPKPLLRMAAIAAAKANYARSRSLRLRAAQILMDTQTSSRDAALAALTAHLESTGKIYYDQIMLRAILCINACMHTATLCASTHCKA
jgi:hypothetical protein